MLRWNFSRNRNGLAWGPMAHWPLSKLPILYPGPRACCTQGPGTAAAAVQTHLHLPILYQHNASSDRKDEPCLHFLTSPSGNANNLLAHMVKKAQKEIMPSHLTGFPALHWIPWGLFGSITLVLFSALDRTSNSTLQNSTRSCLDARAILP